MSPGIQVKEGESLERALRRWKKRCEKAGILDDFLKHSHFRSSGERKKRKRRGPQR